MALYQCPKWGTVSADAVVVSNDLKHSGWKGEMSSFRGEMAWEFVQEEGGMAAAGVQRGLRDAVIHRDNVIYIKECRGVWWKMETWLAEDEEP